MRSCERPEFEPLSFPARPAEGLREDAVTPEVVAAIEKLAGSIALLAEKLSDNRAGSQKPADTAFPFMSI